MSITQEIASGKFDAELDEIITMARLRKNTVARIEAANLNAGDIVELMDVRPKYLVGSKARVVANLGNKLSVEIISELQSARYSGTVKVPVACVRRVQ